mmetsp:Transcript_22566/g.55724  ORF Transcript_22566/g.55724 Transcript_22566/m.55724 type:complete len:93 (+) Transcript_22566:112-390(+)|eukprot:6246048-Prymnesium_polylepis.1
MDSRSRTRMCAHAATPHLTHPSEFPPILPHVHSARDGYLAHCTQRDRLAQNLGYWRRPPPVTSPAAGCWKMLIDCTGCGRRPIVAERGGATP